MVAFGMHFYGLHLNWWETVLVFLFVPSLVVAFGEMFD